MRLKAEDVDEYLWMPIVIVAQLFLVILFPFWLIIIFSYIFLIKKLKQTIKDKNPHKLDHEYLTSF